MESSNLPGLIEYTARDGSLLSYRHYYTDKNTNNIVILLHGISEDSKYLYPLASYISDSGLADVVTPDLRGYGEKPNRRGDVDYIGQLEDDLADLIKVLRQQFAEAQIIMAGHSAGGGTAIRFAESNYANLVDNYLLLSPFIHFFAPIMKKVKKGEGASSPKVGRIAALMFLNSIGYKGRNYLPVFTRNKPQDKLHGTETLTLSYRLFMSRIPNNYKKALTKLPNKTLLLIGDEDAEFDHSKFEPLFSTYKNTDVHVISGANHDSILYNEDSWNKVKDWILSN